MTIKEVFEHIFNCVILNKDEYNELINFQNELENTEKHNSYVKFWICVAECKNVVIHTGYSYYNVTPKTIAGDRLFYTRTDDNGITVNEDICLEQVSIPEQFKADVLGTYYDPTDKWQIMK